MLAGWIALTYWFSRRQFERALRTDAAETRAPDEAAATKTYFGEVLLAVPRKLVGDPVASLIEKEIRTLSRSPRFRLLFFMGFSFGLLIWLPMMLRSDADSALRANYLTLVSAYALMLLGEVCFWNIFGMDRTAALAYLVMPVKFTTVLLAKNAVGGFFVALEIAIVTLFCYLLRMPVTGVDVAEAFAVTAVLVVYLFAIGNLMSTSYPRAVDPTQSWRTGSVGRIQAMLLVVYPLVSLPVLLAYGAQYAFESDAAFYGVLLIDFVIGLLVYRMALSSAASTVRTQIDRFVLALSSAEGPVGS
jgi:ABC-2 type transport system permease protein